MSILLAYLFGRTDIAGAAVADSEFGRLPHHHHPAWPLAVDIIVPFFVFLLARPIALARSSPAAAITTATAAAAAAAVAAGTAGVSVNVVEARFVVNVIFSVIVSDRYKKSGKPSTQCFPRAIAEMYFYATVQPSVHTSVHQNTTAGMRGGSGNNRAKYHMHLEWRPRLRRFRRLISLPSDSAVVLTSVLLRRLLLHVQKRNADTRNIKSEVM